MRLALLLLVAVLSYGQDIAAKADEYLQTSVKTSRFMGAVLLSRDGKVLFARGYGMADAEHDVPNTPQTKFRLGSITKQFAATATLQLEEGGKLSITDPVCKYISECPEAWKAITIYHLLTHTSGIWNFTTDPEYRNTWMLPSRPEKTMQRFLKKPLESEPGFRYNYSNSGYILLAYILEKASGMRFEELLEKNIFKPLGMKDTGHDTWEAILKHRARGYQPFGDKLIHAPYHDMSIPIGGGDLYSTVEDLRIWDQALYTDKVLSAKSREKAFTPFKNNYGLGWVVTQVQGRKVIMHGGGINGFSTQISRFPEDRSLVVVLSNNQASPMAQIGRHLTAILFGEKSEAPKSGVAGKLE
jgi:CubicO group peptidase (beta-lactamase class C family)